MENLIKWFKNKNNTIHTHSKSRFNIYYRQSNYMLKTIFDRLDNKDNNYFYGDIQTCRCISFINDKYSEFKCIVCVLYNLESKKLDLYELRYETIIDCFKANYLKSFDSINEVVKYLDKKLILL